GSLTKTGAGLLTVSSPGNSYSGPTVIAGGTLQLSYGVSSPGLADYYSFAGNAIDTGGGANGTVGSGVSFPTVTGPAGTQIAVASLPNGGGGGISMGALPAFNSGTQARTISAWVQQTATPANTGFDTNYFGFYPGGTVHDRYFYFDEDGGAVLTECFNDS